jgi:hypothetical protein
MAKYININMQRPKFDFIDSKCIGRRCFHPVNGCPTCSNKKHHGCPNPLPEFDKSAAERNKANGWRLSQ